ncbi:MAG TPA: inositol monophosphatase family protein [Acidobacteriaceae bacterium]|jgi:myo-inositol-1(or 4)-monophosphatase|nr:inositol monophosphatase family protein [Acidobacteriaceae bacterium]
MTSDSLASSLYQAHDTLKNRLLIACAAAREAGALQKRRFLDRDAMVVKFKGPQDYLTATDGEVEKLVRSRLLEAFPGDTFLGEEDGGQVSARTWVVDPIDGTSNFARGIAHFCISIALVLDGVASIGVIYQPMTDELFAAAKGLGATLNGEPIKTSSTTTLDKSLLEVGRASRQPKATYLAMLDQVMASGAGIRGAGSGALAVANVACGRVDGCFETHMYSWDCLAGLVLVEEAGGRVNDFLAGDGLLKGNKIFAAAPGIAEEFANVVGVSLPASK